MRDVVCTDCLFFFYANDADKCNYSENKSLHTNTVDTAPGHEIFRFVGTRSIDIFIIDIRRLGCICELRLARLTRDEFIRQVNNSYKIKHIYTSVANVLRDVDIFSLGCFIFHEYERSLTVRRYYFLIN